MTQPGRVDRNLPPPRRIGAAAAARRPLREHPNPLEPMPSHPRTIRRTKPLATLLLASSLAACAVNPVTGERQLALITEAQEIEMGRSTAAQVEQSIGLVQDQALQNHLQQLGARLAAASERPHLPWTFRVVDDPTPNAFALPGGYIFITRGLLNLMDSEAELATVLGHEIAHVTARHSVSAISRQQIAQLGLGLGGVLFPQLQPLGDVAGAGLGLLFLKHGRGAERQADELGFGYALAQGFDVREMPDVFVSLRRFGELEKRSAIPSWLATHPAPEERIEDTRERLAALQQPLDRTVVGRAEFLGRLDGMVYGEDPRQGFFQQNVFLHPELRFRLDFPARWAYQNSARAVMAVSPQKDAAIQLTLAEAQGAENATRRFFGQQGIRAVRSTRQTINGIPAVVSAFEAQTQQGVIAGYVTFLEYGGRTYQLVAYAPGARIGNYDRLFQQVIGTFGPVDDPRVLNAQPARIDIVRTERAMTLGEFDRRYPSAVPITTLAILNQVEGATTPITAGSLVKRVVAGTVPTQ